MTDIATPLIETPCVKTCVIDPETDLCIGCARTRDEIANWIFMGDIGRASVMAKLNQRMESMTKLKTRRGGRAGRLVRIR